MDNGRTVRANKKLSFASSESDGPTKEHSCDENHDTSNSRTNVKKSRDVEKKKRVKRTQKRIASPVKQIIVKKTPKTVGQTKIKSRIDKEVGKFCSPVLTFLGSLSGMYAVRPLPQAVVVWRSFCAFHMHRETQKLLNAST
jgi:hypothetical protein